MLFSSDTIPSARLFTHLISPAIMISDAALSYSVALTTRAIIPALHVLGARRAVQGSAVYTIFFNCLGNNPFAPPVPSILIDDTQITGSWYSSIPDWDAPIFWRNADLDNRPGDDWIDDPRFDLRSALTTLQHEFIDNLSQLIPSTVYIIDVEALRSHLIREAALKGGIL